MNLSMVGNASRRIIDIPEQTKAAPAQQRVLNILSEEDGLTQGILAEILDVRPSSLAEVLKKLEMRGDIKRIEDEKDKRIKNVFITEAGRKKVTASSVNKDRSSEFFMGLTFDKQQELNGLLTELIAGWPAEFRQSIDIPHNPMDALEMMQSYRDEFMKKCNIEDIEKLNPRERRQKQREWKESMRDVFEQHVRGRRRDLGREPFQRGEMNRGPFQNNSIDYEGFPHPNMEQMDYEGFPHPNMEQMDYEGFPHPNMEQLDWWQRHFSEFHGRGFHDTDKNNGKDNSKENGENINKDKDSKEKK